MIAFENFRRLACLALCGFSLSVVQPASALSADGPRLEPGDAVRTVTPVFSQLLMLSLPGGFKQVLEESRTAQYVRAFVAEGESFRKWSQKVTITGEKWLALNPNIAPQAIADRMAAGLRKACPPSFSGAVLGPMKVGTYDAFSVVIGCGIVDPDGSFFSETVLIVVIKGENDFYTVQWAERGNASVAPLEIDAAQWRERLGKLAPLALCPVVKGENAPYSSCTSGAK